MGDNSYELRQILAELREQTRILREIKKSVDAVESAVWDTAPE